MRRGATAGRAGPRRVARARLDLRVTQLVDGTKGVHGRLAKGVLR